MPDTTTSPNMSLIIPTVSVDPGPDWANNINASLSILDQHNHSAGSGVAISQDGISLSASVSTYDSLNFNASNAFGLRSVRFTAQAAALALSTDKGCLYESGVDLYYNDGSGNQIRLTQGGSIVGTAGSISGLPSGTASASYSGGTFVWQSATNTAANMDAGSYILRNSTASSKGLTLSPPNAMAADYSLVLPSVPGSTGIMRLDTSGNMSASLLTDGTTVTISSNTLKVADGGINTTQLANDAVTTAKIDDGAVTKAKLAALGQQISSANSGQTVTSTSYVDLTNLSVSITIVGRPVFIGIIASGAGSAEFSFTRSGDNLSGQVRLLRDATAISDTSVAITANGANPVLLSPNPNFWMIDNPGAGTYTYKYQAKVSSGTTLSVNNIKMVAYEL